MLRKRTSASELYRAKANQSLEHQDIAGSQNPMMNSQTLSRGQCLASHICKGSSLRPRQAAHAHLSSVQRLGQANAELATSRGSTCSTKRLLTTTRAENGNGASPAPSGLSIDLRGSLDYRSRISPSRVPGGWAVTRLACCCRQEGLHCWCCGRSGKSIFAVTCWSCKQLSG